MKLTPKQKRFVDEYMIDLNATQAAVRAGYSAKTANAQAGRLLVNVSVQKAIQKAQKQVSKKLDVSVERVVKEYARLGFLDPRKFFSEDGSPKSIIELDDDTASALAGFEVMDIWEGQGENRTFVGYLKKYKLTDKKGALDSLGKHLGMFVERHEHTGKDGKPIESNITIASRTAGMSDEEKIALAKELREMEDDPEDELPTLEGTE